MKNPPALAGGKLKHPYLNWC